MLEARVITSIVAIGREAWDRLFPDEVESFAYLRAVEASGLDGFDWRYVVVVDAGQLLAAVPMFLTTYALDTTLGEVGRRMVAGARRVFPTLLNLPLACLGSPCTEMLPLGFSPETRPGQQPALLRLILDAFEAEAERAGAHLMGVKDVPACQEPLWNAVAVGRGYRGIAGMPVASLDIAFHTQEAYLATLSAATRKNMRRKLRNRAKVRLEWRHDLEGVLDETMALYRQTRDRADMQFEDLTPAYFSGVSEGMGEQAVYGLYWSGNDLLAVNMLLRGDDILTDKFFVMDGERGRELDLYFLSWFNNIDYCLEEGLARYQSGSAAYDIKLRLGSTLIGTSLYFRHRSRVINSGLNLVAPLFAADPTLRSVA
ncbi:MAG: peptidogalycan biosysnthesis protein [Brevundimonas sp.]